MIKIIFGLILFSAPFLLTGLFKDKKRGFLYVLFFLLSSHIVLAFFTQFLGIFHYWIIMAISFLANIAIVFFFFKKAKTGFSLKAPRSLWLFGMVTAISFLSLYQVHYNYNGEISILTDSKNSYYEIKNMKYVYPYFSDEWYSVSFIKSSISSHSLPLKNALDNNSFFPNLEMFSHSLLAELTLFFGVNPLLQYVLISIFVNTLIVALSYVFLRINKVSELSSAISSLSILYIASSDSLPGIWHLIPITIGIIFILIGFCFISLDDAKMAFFSFLAASLFYPLLFPFYGLAAIIFLFSKFRGEIIKISAGLFSRKQFWRIITDQFNFFKKKNHRAVICFFSSAALFFGSIAALLSIIFFQNLIKYALSRLFYVSLLGNFIPQMNIFYIIPLLVIFLSFFGFIFVFYNKKWLFSQIVVGAFYWILYFFTTNRIIIDFERVVYFTSIIIVLTSGFGSDVILKLISSKIGTISQKVIKRMEITVVLLFLSLVHLYTDSDNWKKMVAINYEDGGVAFPAAPANRYLAEDDIRIFKNIKGKRFLSIPWKGTVIGVATDNYPVLAKSGTISIGLAGDANLFLFSDCETKKKIAAEKKIDYVYLSDFNCDGFEKVEKSAEGFVLQKIITKSNGENL